MAVTQLLLDQIQEVYSREGRGFSWRTLAKYDLAGLVLEGRIGHYIEIPEDLLGKYIDPSYITITEVDSGLVLCGLGNFEIKKDIIELEGLTFPYDTEVCIEYKYPEKTNEFDKLYEPNKPSIFQQLEIEETKARLARWEETIRRELDNRRQEGRKQAHTLESLKKKVDSLAKENEKLKKVEVNKKRIWSKRSKYASKRFLEAPDLENNLKLVV